MIDYRAIECLQAVLQRQGFDKAGQQLGLTQSAVSQRIKRLEQAFGGPLLIRSKPIKATPLGERVLAHHHKVALLEQSFLKDALTIESLHSLPISINNDALVTWFPSVIAAMPAESNARLHIQAADQSQTRARLQRGEVIACVSDIATPVTGGESVFIGNMHYELVATPDFIKQYLAKGISKQAIVQCPALVYDAYDELWQRYQETYLDNLADPLECHWYPSSSGFLSMALTGTVCALMPSLQVKEALLTGALVSLLPQDKLSVALFWHWYKLESYSLDQLTHTVITVAKQTLEGNA